METWFDTQGCAFWSHKDSEWAVILLIQLSPFEWQYGLTNMVRRSLVGQTILPFKQTQLDE